MGRNTGRGKVAYSWISPDPAKAGPILKGGVVVVIDEFYEKWNDFMKEAKTLKEEIQKLKTNIRMFSNLTLSCLTSCMRQKMRLA